MNTSKFGIALVPIFFILLSAHTPTVFAEDWKREISLGFNQSTGNTDKAEFSAAASIAKDFDGSLFSSAFNIYYSEADGVMDAQKWDSITNYSFDFGEDMDWFNIYKLTVDHDRFSDIDYRLLPSVGVGRWLARSDDWTWSADASLGYQITSFRSGIPDEEGAAFIAHTFAKKRIFENATISEDLSIIPSLEGDGTLVKSITEFTSPLQENLDLNVKYLVDYDTDPSIGKKKTDTRILVGIKYSF